MRKILLTGGVVIAALLAFITMNAKRSQSPTDLVDQNMTNNSRAEAVIPNSPSTGNPVDDVAQAISNETEAENKIASEAEVAPTDFTAEVTETNAINNFYDANKF